MSRIHVLDPIIANKIAAGEVVEKPASVIKELVENAIDAGSTSITVEIKGGGKDYIRVSDNGQGIEPDDVLTAFQRHATSKISEIDDIYNIKSLGFRGEALASIASVSNIELISKTKDNEFGEKIILAGGKILTRESVGASNGTTIVMKDLFFNTPARLKFLKSDGAEQNAISTIVNKLALSHTDISFKYIINDRITFKTPGNNNLKDSVYEIFGKSVSDELIPFELDADANIKANGLLSTIHYTRGNRQLQVIFVNGRYIVNKIVSESLELAYKGLVPLHRHPVCFLFLELDPKSIDVNIHPSKTEIKFHQEAQIKQILYSALRKCINSYNQIPQETFKKVDVFSRPVDVEMTIEEKNSTIRPTFNRTQENEEHYNTVRESLHTNKPTPPKEAVDVLYQSIHDQNFDKKLSNDMLQRKNTTSEKSQNITKEPIGNQYDFKEMLVRETIENKQSKHEYLPEGQSVYDDLLYVGQAFDTYLLFQKDTQLYFIDQHAAHEKILYEDFKEKYRTRKIDAQMLLDPITISLTYNELELILENKSIFEKLGFELEAFGRSDLIIRSVPILFDRPAGKLFIEALIEKIDGSETLSSLQSEEIIMQSCKAAIKANQKVDQLETNHMLRDLRNLTDPYTCPHGRPIIIAIHKYEIERKFKRT